VVTGDLLWGDATDGSGARGSDTFYIYQVTADNAARETSPGSGEFAFYIAATVVDFDAGIDKIALPAALVGDGDTTVGGVSVHASPAATFSSTA
jgi:hypothetical protein